MRKNNYEAPTMQIVEIEKSDIIRTSTDMLEINSKENSFETTYTTVVNGTDIFEITQ